MTLLSKRAAMHWSSRIRMLRPARSGTGPFTTSAKAKPQLREGASKAEPGTVAQGMNDFGSNT